VLVLPRREGLAVAADVLPRAAEGKQDEASGTAVEELAAVIDYDGVLLAQGSALGDSGDRLWVIDGTTGRVCASTVLPSLGTVGMTSVQGALWITTVDGHVIAIPRLLTRLFVRRAGWKTLTPPGGAAAASDPAVAGAASARAPAAPGAMRPNLASP
jgi:hypothetical protein